jgi:hypothetical protein
VPGQAGREGGLDTVAAEGGIHDGGFATDGGDGGAGTSSDGDPADDMNGIYESEYPSHGGANAGGGGGGVGRIRIETLFGVVSTTGAIISPATTTSLFTQGTLAP